MGKVDYEGLKLNFRKSGMQTQLIYSRQRQMGHQHLFRVGGNEPKEREDEILMKESRMVSKSPSQTTKKQQRTNQEHQHL